MPQDPPARPPLPTTAAEYREAAAWYRQRESALADELRQARAMAELHERWAERLESGQVSIGLTVPANEHHNRTEMQPTPVIRYRRGRPSASKHLFVLWLEKNQSSIAEWAEKHRLTRERVKGWVATGGGSRRIPREWAETIEREATDKRTKESAVPATLATWPQGIA